MRSDGRDSHGSSDQERLGWLVPASLIFIGVFFGSRYIRFPFALLAQSVDTMPTPLWLSRRLRWVWMGFLLLRPIDLLFTSLTAYLALSAVGLVLGIAAIALARPRKLSLALLLLGLLAIAALPFVSQYRPAVTVDPVEAHVRVPTQPGRIAGVVKTTQAGAEVRHCEYKLLGWSTQSALYGEETCGTRHRTWVYWPMSDQRLQTVTIVPADLFQQSVSREDLRAEGVRATIPHDETLRITVRESGLASPESGSQGSWWYAFVARHVYGPEDVVVVMR